MSYATVDQIVGEFKDFTPTTTSAITIADIEGFIADADAEIDSLLSSQYTTPITGPKSLKVMKVIEIWLVKHRILDILSVKTGSEKTSQDGQKTYRQMAYDLLNLYIKGTATLIDAVVVTTSSNIGEFYCSDGTPNVFDRTISQW